LRITFHGATRRVTGSSHLLEAGGHRVLLDCGLFDNNRSNPDSPNRRFAYDPRTLDAVIVSHAHNDHIGRLPCLVRAGFDGPIYATPATADILNIMLRDSARIQREDARNAPPGEPSEPLFDLADVEWVVEHLKRLPYGTPLDVVPGIGLTYHNSGHILGSALVQLDCREEGRERRVLFTGDLGRREAGLLPDPTVVRDIDVLISESTYGNKEIDPNYRLMKQLHAIVARAIRLGSKVVIPAFTLGRTQRMVYSLLELFAKHRVKPIPVFVDSPLAARLTDVHREYPDAFSAAARNLMESGAGLFDGESVKYCITWDESRQINSQAGPFVVVTSSGMCDAGRVRHHLRQIVGDPDNAVVIVSYQAEGTLGRQIAEGAERIPIMDRWYDLNCAVYVLDGFSGHADRNDFAWWFEQTGGNIDKAFLVHGEPEGMEALAPLLQPYVGSPVVLPELDESFEL